MIPTLEMVLDGTALWMLGRRCPMVGLRGGSILHCLPTCQCHWMSWRNNGRGVFFLHACSEELVFVAAMLAFWVASVQVPAWGESIHDCHLMSLCRRKSESMIVGVCLDCSHGNMLASVGGKGDPILCLVIQLGGSSLPVTDFLRVIQPRGGYGDH